MVFLSWLYFTFGTLPQLAAFFYGLKPVVVSIVLATTWRLALPFLRDWRFWLLVVLSAGLITPRLLNDFLVFVGAGLLGILLYGLPARPQPKPENGRSSGEKKTGLQGFLPALGLWLGQSQIGGFLDNAGDLTRLAQLGWFFIRAGALIFGGGLVIIPFVQNEVVSGFGWMTAQQFTDGVALGQATPGPVLVTATFVGYAVAGSLLAGAYFVALAAFVLPEQKTGGIPLGNSNILDPYTIIIGLIGLVLLVRFKINTIWLFALAGGFGLLFSLLPFRLPGMGMA
jgi:chromate transporter